MMMIRANSVVLMRPITSSLGKLYVLLYRRETSMTVLHLMVQLVKLDETYATSHMDRTDFVLFLKKLD